MIDPVEVSRQAAERLHSAAVSSGCDPWNGYDFACAEATRRNLAVEKVPLGDVRLHGGRALYDPDALLILHEDAGDSFTNAFLVAHEIGHVECGGQNEFSTTATPDPMRSVEASPVGLDRVVDYSRRERREVQMDLFAREFLLPRSWLRRLHVEEGLSASEISARCRAPHAVIAQQLLDALLLPPVSLSSPPHVAPKPFNQEQNKAITHRGKPYLLEAGPGTGKTQTLVGRITDLISAGTDPNKILVLTFSNKAAGELSERIAHSHPQAATAMWIGTFHAFGLDLIRRFHDRLGLPTEPRLLDRSEAIELLENEYPRLNLVHFKNLWDPSQPLGTVLDAISRANDEVVDAAHYQQLAEAMLRSASSDEQKVAAERSLEVAKVFASYEQIKLKNGYVDFGDLVAGPVRLCETYADVQEHLSARYEHVLVDEFQDVNRSSIRLLTALTRSGENLWVVGDAKQSIYRFRGASSFNMARFGIDDFAGGERGRLTVNYRSTSEVCDTFLTFATGMNVVAGADVSLQAERGSTGYIPECRSADTDQQEVAAVAESIEEMRHAGYSYRDQAILCSGNDRLVRFAEGIEQLGIPVLYLGNLFERSEIKDLLCLLSLMVDRRAMGLLRIAAMPHYTVSLADISCVLTHLKDNDSAPLQWVTDAGSIHGLSNDGGEGLRRIGKLLLTSDISENPWTLLSQVLFDRSRLAADIATSADIRARSQGVAIWQFMNFLRNQPPGSGLPIVRVLERIRRLVLHSDERDLRQLPAAAQGIDAVRLMTMHGSKGLEFPVVHIPGLTSASMPRSPNAALARGIAPPDGLIAGASGSGIDATKQALVEEQECLFFVALSRARDRLFLYHPTITANGRSRPRSPFIGRLGATIRSQDIVPSLTLPPVDGELPVPIKIVGAFAFSDYQLALYERCPRRFLYTHVLEVGGRRTESAFMKLHVAVQHVVDGLSQQLDTQPSLAEIEIQLANEWDSHGPADHGYSDEYKRIAWQLIRFFIDSSSGSKRLPAPQLRLPVAGGEIVVTPDQVLTDDTGNVRMRRVRTGHKKSNDDDSLAAAAFHIAASAHSPGCTVELVFLSDGAITPIEMTSRVLGNRKNSIAQMGAGVKDGHFPLKEGPTCPRCPAYYVCPSLPPGPLNKNFSA
ncbi:MAG: UvrD-helicase domain-containing protein [Pirellulales bacterium]